LTYRISGNPASINSRCFYQEQGALNYAQVNFNCPQPGLVGKVVTLQNLGGYNLEVLEIETLGKQDFIPYFSTLSHIFAYC
jgi:hypothetical protein